MNDRPDWFRELVAGTGHADGLDPDVRETLVRALTVRFELADAEQRARDRLLADEARAHREDVRRERDRADAQRAALESAKAQWRATGDELHLHLVDLTSDRPWDPRDGDWRSELMTKLAESPDEPYVHSWTLGTADGAPTLVPAEEGPARWIRLDAPRKRYARVPTLDRVLRPLGQALREPEGRRTLVIVLHPQLRSGSNRWSLRYAEWAPFHAGLPAHVGGVLHLFPCAVARVSVRDLHHRGVGMPAPFGLSQAAWRTARRRLPALAQAFVDAGGAR